MRAKICGITRLQDALGALKYGAWALGFNFYRESPRFISVQAAQQLIQQLPKNGLKVGIFIEETDEEIAMHMQNLQLDFAQVYTHRPRSEALMNKMWLGLHAAQAEEIPSMPLLKGYAAILLDAPQANDGLLGGTGRKSNWGLAKKLAKQHRLILAGGLTPTSISEAIQTVQPFAVDVASGVEVSPGQKDGVLLKTFLGACHGST